MVSGNLTERMLSSALQTTEFVSHWMMVGATSCGSLWEEFDTMQVRIKGQSGFFHCVQLVFPCNLHTDTFFGLCRVQTASVLYSVVTSRWSVTEILVQRKFWSGGPKFPGPKFLWQVFQLSYSLASCSNTNKLFVERVGLHHHDSLILPESLCQHILLSWRLAWVATVIRLWSLWSENESMPLLLYTHSTQGFTISVLRCHAKI